MKHRDMIEGPEAFKRFKNVMKTVLAVPHSEAQKRIEEHRERAEKNPNRRGRSGNPLRLPLPALLALLQKTSYYTSESLQSCQ